MLAEFLKRELAMDEVVFVENQASGRFLRGRKQGKPWELLVISSGHIWMRRPGERSWTTTQIYVPDRIYWR